MAAMRDINNLISVEVDEEFLIPQPDGSTKTYVVKQLGNDTRNYCVFKEENNTWDVDRNFSTHANTQVVHLTIGFLNTQVHVTTSYWGAYEYSLWDS